MFSFCLVNRPDILIGTSVEISYVGKILGIPSINVNEDDAEAVPLYAKLGYPLASIILTPQACNNGRWENKTIKYAGYHELGYLHSNHFSPDRSIVEQYFSTPQRYFLIRFAKLNAHHDAGVKGINSDIAAKIIRLLEFHGKVFITSERELEPQFEKYRVAANPLFMHHAVYFAKMFIGDSQTMTAEAAVLGTASLRFSDFVGKIGYLEELEHKYGLTFGINTSEPKKLYRKIEEFLSTPNLEEEWQRRRQRMLSEKIDVGSFMTWFIENFPQSVEIMRRDSDFQWKFK